jgi:hypothetical protein
VRKRRLFFDRFLVKGENPDKMSFPLLIVLFQQLRATQPSYFFLVTLLLLIIGGVGWLIAAVLGFARSPAFGPSARWFSYAAVCLIIYHLHFLLFGVFVFLGSQQANDLSTALGIGAFFNLFVVLGAVCAIMGFVRMTNPR